MTGTEIPCLYEMLKVLHNKTNEKGFFGPVYDGIIDEFQYGGHTWYMRALFKLAEYYHDNRYLEMAKKVFEGLFLPAKGYFKNYPVERPFFDGDMLGSEIKVNEWILCSDVGAAFLAIDGLADYYITTKDKRAYELIEEMTETFAAIDKLKLRTQTHANLRVLQKRYVL